MVERAEARRSAQERILRLTAAYRSILSRYAEIERLSREEHRNLARGGALSAVVEALSHKRQILREIQLEEGQVKGEREWWKSSRGGLPQVSCEALLSLLDQVQLKIEGILALESEGRRALESLLAAGPGASAPLVSATSASLAYTQGRSTPGGRP